MPAAALNFELLNPVIVYRRSVRRSQYGGERCSRCYCSPQRGLNNTVRDISDVVNWHRTLNECILSVLKKISRSDPINRQSTFVIRFLTPCRRTTSAFLSAL
jgi:hypothetical protein